MNALPLVSVVVPNYNYKRYLNLRIQSILQQTYQNIELILLDDASTDGSEEVLSDYQDHANPFKQWFKGMQLAKGKYIWIAEADDLCELTFLEKVVPLMEKYQQAAVCFAGSKYIDKDGNVLSYDMNKWKSAIPPYAVFNGKTYAEHNHFQKKHGKCPKYGTMPANALQRRLAVLVLYGNARRHYRKI